MSCYACPLDEQKEANIELMLSKRSDYSITQINGQRLYAPVNHWPQQPKRGSEIFIGRLPRDCYEDELVPVFEKAGVIYKLRLMMDFSGSTRGYAFLTYSNESEAENAVNTINDTEVRDGHRIGVSLSWDNMRLFIGGIPRNKTRKQILSEMRRVTEGVKNVNVCVYDNTNNNNNRNHGFAFVEYESHYLAAMARRSMATRFATLWNCHNIRVDWADPQQDIDEQMLKTIKVLFVRIFDEEMSANDLKDMFTFNGLRIERVVMIKDFAFIHYETRTDAEVALNTIQSQTFLEINPQFKYIHVSWARPQRYSARKKRNVYSASNNCLMCTSSNTEQFHTQVSDTSQPIMSNNHNVYETQCFPNQVMPQIIPLSILSAYDYTEPIPLYTDYVKQLTKTNYF